MDDLDVLESKTSADQRIGILTRQISGEVTQRQIIFDVVFGVIAPVLCFAFDPIVFRSGFAGPPVVPEYQLLVYLFSGLQIIVLCLWLILRSKSHTWNGLIAGVLICGGVFCVAIGVLLLPFSVIGLMFGIGLFGFAPFFTSIAYLRNGIRAWHSPIKAEHSARDMSALMLGIVLVVGMPVIIDNRIHAFVNQSVNEIIHGDSQHALAAAHALKPLGFVADSQLNSLLEAYLAESDPARKEILKNCYREITGKDVETQIRILRD